jgi:hypothetical protein
MKISSNRSPSILSLSDQSKLSRMSVSRTEGSVGEILLNGLATLQDEIVLLVLQQMAEEHREKFLLTSIPHLFLPHHDHKALHSIDLPQTTPF